MPDPHPICRQMRALRRAAGLSLADMQDHFAVNPIVVGAYERGDRIPPLPKADALLRNFGYRLSIEPIGPSAVRQPSDMIEDLRAIADQLERHYDRLTAVHSRPDSEEESAADPAAATA